MPGFISHTVMARDVYNRLNNKNVDLDYMTTYSLGGDLSKYAKCRYDSHHKDQDKFIYVMADYIKNNKLINDKEAMAVLYGHICHYVMDDIMHPLIRKVDKTCAKGKKNHTLIEEYYDSYLVKEVFKTNKKDYVKKRILSGKVNKKITRMLDVVYSSVYETKHVSEYYKFNLFLYRMLKNTYRFINIKLIEKVSGLTEFLTINKDVDLVNDKREISYKNSFREDDSASLIDLYYISIENALAYIDNVNKYLEI